MAIAFGASLGTPVTDTENSANSIALTTNVTVPSNGFAAIGVSWYNAGVTASVSGYTSDAQRNGTVDSSRHLALFRQTYASGLASGSTITASFSGGAFGRAIFGVYFTSVATSSPLDQVATSQGTGTAWNGGSITTGNANDVLVGVTWFDTELTTETPAAGYTEAIDVNNSLNACWAFVYQIVSATSTYTPGGTWAAASTGGREWLAVSSSYKEAGGGGGGTTVKQLAALGVG